jgi:hypothetical protein
VVIYKVSYNFHAFERFNKHIVKNLIFVYMNIQAEKIEVIKMIADIESEKVLKKIKGILKSEKSDETSRILSNPVMAKRLDESIQQIQDGKGIKISMNNFYQKN